MAKFLIAPCHFLGAAAWSRVRPRLEAAGHQVWPVELTGWGERRAQLSRDVGLSTHVRDVVDVLEANDWDRVTLVGHSYGGMVAAGAVAACPDRIGNLVFLDAFVPRNGDSVFDLMPDYAIAWYREHASGNGWEIPPPGLELFGLNAEDVAWATPFVGPVSLRTCEERLLAPGDPLWSLPRTYIWCRDHPFYTLTAARIRESQGWNYRELDSNHLPMITHSAALADLLEEAALR